MVPRIQQVFAEKQVSTLKHTSYSSDLAPCDFSVYPKLKISIKEIHFQLFETSIRKRQSYLKHFHKMISGDALRPGWDGV
jgi:hypothetical protein